MYQLSAASRFFRIKQFGACINCQRPPASSIVSGLPLGTFRLGIMITTARVFFVIFDVLLLYYCSFLCFFFILY